MLLYFLVLDTKASGESVAILQVSNQSHSYISFYLGSTSSFTKWVQEHFLIGSSQKCYEVDIVTSALWIRTLKHGLRSRKFDNNLKALSTLLQLPLTFQKSLFTSDVVVDCDLWSVKTWFWTEFYLVKL